MRIPGKAALLLCCLAVASGRHNKVTLILDWAQNCGLWGDTDMCPEGTFAFAFQIKVLSPQGLLLDDSSMNGIRLICSTPEDVYRNDQQHAYHSKEFTVSSKVQKWGKWKYRRTCPRGFLTGLRMKSEEEKKGWLGDNTAANDLEMKCDHSTGVLNGGGNQWGHYSTWESCPLGWAICGLQTKVAKHSGDDTALNDVKMYCCKV